jgi:hypothetical protein
MLALPGAGAEETAAAKDLVNALKGDGARQLAKALGKVAARDSGDSLFALVMENSVAVDMGYAESARAFAQSLGGRFHNGELSVIAAVTELMDFRSQREMTAAR